jgi:hypothetical protein
MIGASAVFTARSKQLAALALRHSMPTVYESRAFVAAGGLASYGGSLTDSYRLAGAYVGRMAKSLASCLSSRARKSAICTDHGIPGTVGVLGVASSARDAPHQPRRSGYTLRQNFSTLSTEQLDRAQWRHTIRIVHRHCRAFQRGRCGATLRKGRPMMGQERQCTCAEGQRTGRSIDRAEPCHGWLLMR